MLSFLRHVPHQMRVQQSLALEFRRTRGAHKLLIADMAPHVRQQMWPSVRRVAANVAGKQLGGRMRRLLVSAHLATVVYTRPHCEHADADAVSARCSTSSWILRSSVRPANHSSQYWHLAVLEWFG